MSRELQLQLKPGDQIIATEAAYHDSGNFSQQPGDIIMVNNPHINAEDPERSGNSVSGTGLNGTAYNGRECLGLGGSLKVGTFRRATPKDPGFMATREQWQDYKDQKIQSLADENRFLLAVIAHVRTRALYLVGLMGAVYLASLGLFLNFLYNNGSWIFIP